MKINFIIFCIFIIIKTIETNELLINNKYFNVIPDNSMQKYSHKENDNLYFIFSIFRHGARAPMDKELHNNTDILGGKWNNKAELTSTGRKQHYMIGTKNKKRYSDFINNTYNPEEILIYSTCTDRTMSSAQCQLLGLYNGLSYTNELNFDDITNNTEFDINLKSIIPPIHLFKERKNYHTNLLFKRPKSKYETILQYSKFCPPMVKLINKNYEDFETNPDIDSFIYEFNKKYGDILKKKYNIDIFTNRKELKGFCDAYISDYFDENNKKLLELFTSEGFNITDLLYECYYYHGYYLFEIDGNGYAKNNSILSMSTLMREIINIMNERKLKNNKYTSNKLPKYFLISSHDTSLVMIQLFFKYAFGTQLDYPYLASNFVIELRKYNDIFFVEAYLNDFLKLNTSLEEFEEKILNISYDEKYVINYCLEITNYSFDTIILILIGVAFIHFILFLYLIKYCCSSKYKKVKGNSSINVTDKN